MLNEYDIWFSNINISNENKLNLLKSFKDSKTIWNLNKKELKEGGISEENIKRILEVKAKTSLPQYINYIEKNNIQIISCNSKKYPTLLRFIENKPAFLYVKGKIENLYDDCVSIVGARYATTYGKEIARKISKEIADKNINVVSGLAIGIDKYAHLGALDSKIGKTIAVLGTGIDNIYPYENKKVFERILEKEGTILSEFKLGTKPERYNFPLRNRIISGISKKIIVVEAKEKSGSLITADYAIKQGKDVYAVPGNITSNNSYGTNKLISEGAYIFREIDDLFVL